MEKGKLLGFERADQTKPRKFIDLGEQPENHTDFGNKSHRYMNLQQTLGLNTKIGRIGITGK